MGSSWTRTRLETVVALAQLLECVEALARPAPSAEGYRRLVLRSNGPVRRHPADAGGHPQRISGCRRVFENLQYQHSGLCRALLELSVFSEQLAKHVIAHAGAWCAQSLRRWYVRKKKTGTRLAPPTSQRASHGDEGDNHESRPHSADHRDPHAGWCAAHLATQHHLGLLAEQRARLGLGCARRVAGRRTHLATTALESRRRFDKRIAQQRQRQRHKVVHRPIAQQRC